MHMIEQELKRHNHQIPFCRLYAEALFVVNAFTFYNGVSPYNAHTGRQPACLPDLENIDYPQGGELTNVSREQRIREAGLEAITQSTAIAKINRALKASTTIDGSRLFKPGDLIDYHRPIRPPRTSMVGGMDHIQWSATSLIEAVLSAATVPVRYQSGTLTRASLCSWKSL